MGIVLWAACGAVAFIVARIMPARRRPGWITDLAASLAGALLAGFVATGLDFGGWKALDWRAGAFAFFVALAVTGIIRAISAARRKP
jgi:uncharacterized membrane protein YeaQ/YmgE (transglycosylase-associated protein family)